MVDVADEVVELEPIHYCYLLIGLSIYTISPPEILLARTKHQWKSKVKNIGFGFLYNEETPPDNNASERAIRNAKVKQKVSGQFKSGQQVFCILRSVIDTAIKVGDDVFSAIFNIATVKMAE